MAKHIYIFYIGFYVLNQQIDFLDIVDFKKISSLGHIASDQLLASAYWPSIQRSLNPSKILLKNNIGRNNVKKEYSSLFSILLSWFASQAKAPNCLKYHTLLHVPMQLYTPLCFCGLTALVQCSSTMCLALFWMKKA